MDSLQFKQVVDLAQLVGCSHAHPPILTFLPPFLSLFFFFFLFSSSDNIHCTALSSFLPSIPPPHKQLAMDNTTDVTPDKQPLPTILQDDQPLEGGFTTTLSFESGLDPTSTLGTGDFGHSSAPTDTLSSFSSTHSSGGNNNTLSTWSSTASGSSRRGSMQFAKHEVKETLNASVSENADGFLQLKQYVLKGEIGKGAFGKVHYAVDETTKTEYVSFTRVWHYALPCFKDGKEPSDSLLDLPPPPPKPPCTFPSLSRPSRSSASSNSERRTRPICSNWVPADEDVEGEVLRHPVQLPPSPRHWI